MVVHHIPPENLSTFIALHVAFTFFVSTTPSYHTVCKNFLETEVEALKDKEIFPFFTTYHYNKFRWLFSPAVWDTPGTQRYT
jgi:hypothetical protein